MLIHAWISVALAGQVHFDGEGHAYNPVISPDGKFIAFEVNRYSGDIDLFVAPLTGADAGTAYKVALPGSTMLGWGTGQAMVNPTWHPEGILLYEGASSDGRFRLYSHQPGISPHSSEMVSNEELEGDLTFPVVSPDGKKMAFVSDATGHGDIRTRDTLTGELGHLTQTPQSEMYPLYHKDGKKIVYSRKTGEGDLGEDLYAIGSDGADDKLVTGGPGHQTRPVYAGSSILFFDSSRGETEWDLVVLSAINSRRDVLGRDIRLPLRARPAVTADGAWVAYTFEAPQNGKKVMLAKVDGTRTVEIPSGYTACGEPMLARAGDRVLLAYTALPTAEADWRLLYVEDVTGKL